MVYEVSGECGQSEPSPKVSPLSGGIVEYLGSTGCFLGWVRTVRSPLAVTPLGVFGSHLEKLVPDVFGFGFFEHREVEVYDTVGFGGNVFYGGLSFFCVDTSC